jgi:hypothetical protein
MEIYRIGEGMPTGPDVAAIQRQWPDLSVGDRILYEDVEALIGAEWRSARFKAVTDAWRRKEIESGRVIEVEPGKAFFVAEFGHTSGCTQDVFRKVGRKLKKHRTKLATYHPENSAEKAVRDHQMKLCYIMERETKKSRMNILPDTSVKALPQIGPPSGNTA